LIHFAELPVRAVSGHVESHHGVKLVSAQVSEFVHLYRVGVLAEAGLVIVLLNKADV
jgi:hypothetical protein